MKPLVEFTNKNHTTCKFKSHNLFFIAPGEKRLKSVSILPFADTTNFGSLLFRNQGLRLI